MLFRSIKSLFIVNSILKKVLFYSTCLNNVLYHFDHFDSTSGKLNAPESHHTLIFQSYRGNNIVLHVVKIGRVLNYALNLITMQHVK